MHSLLSGHISNLDMALAIGYTPSCLRVILFTGLWVSVFYLALFMGSTLSGLLLTACGFELINLIAWIQYSVMLVADLLELSYVLLSSGSEYKQLDS